MEFSRNPLDSTKTKLQSKTGYPKAIIKELYQTLKNNKLNILFIILFLLTPVAYELLNFIHGFSNRDQVLRTTKSYYVFNDYLTVFFQNTLGTTKSLIGIFSAYFYTFGFILLSTIAFIMLFSTVLFRKKEYRRREPYVYIPIIIVMVLIDIIAYFIVPTAPPVRIYPNLFFRTIILPVGDKLISIKYNALPSGHIYALTVPYLVAKAEGYKKWKNLFGGGLILTSWVILLTGDHYPLDIFTAYLLTFLLFTLFTTVYDYYNPKTVRVNKEKFFKRIRATLLTMLTLIVMAIITFTYVSSLFFILQLTCIVIVWPTVVFTTNTDGLINNAELYKRSLFTDLKDAYYSVKSKI